jgi:arginyl-tRNA synthetase
MFTLERQAVENQIRAYCTNQGLPELSELTWSPVPFTGEWGISTSFFQLAANQARQLAATGERVNVAQRAQEIAAGAAEYLGTPAGFSHVAAT